MAVKDIIGPGIGSFSAVGFIVTRGLHSAVASGPIISRRISIIGNDSRRMDIIGNDGRRVSVLGNDGRRIRLKGN